MKLIIDIPEELYKKQFQSGWVGNIIIHDAIVNGITLHENVTNGDVIKTLFPSCKTRSENTPTNFMEFTLDGIVGYAIEKSWWNARYNAESEDKE